MSGTEKGLSAKKRSSAGEIVDHCGRVCGWAHLGCNGSGFNVDAHMFLLGSGWIGLFGNSTE